MKFYTCIVAIVCALTVASAIEDGIVCPTEQLDTDYVVLIPSKIDCSVFYKCNRGIAHKVTCPDGLHYNTHLQACDFPLRAKCQLNNGI